MKPAHRGCLAAFLFAVLPAGAQMNMPDQGMAAPVMEMKDQIPPGQLPPPKTIRGAGTVQMKITGSPRAQMWFNQGLNLLHDYWDYESARAFEQAVRVDPKCAMCYWGLYKAESFYHSTTMGYAGQALDKAVSLKDGVSRRERLYIEATAALEDGRRHPGGQSMMARPVEIWRDIVKEYPRDTQARIFLASAVGGKEAIELLESVMRDEPDNSAAHHYYIHDLEPTDHPERALHSAEILGRLAPASGHMVHMPGHIYFRVGDYASAERAFAASMEVDERYMRKQHIAPDDDWNYVHNLMYAIANLMEEGKFSEATALSAKIGGARGQLDTTLYSNSARDSISRLNAHLPVSLRTADWAQTTDLLKGVTAQTRWPHLDFLARQLADFAAGMQAVNQHDLAKARECSTRFDSGLSRMSPGPAPMTMPTMAMPPKIEVMPDAMLRPLVNMLSVMSLELQAALLTAEGKTVDAKPVFAKAAEAERRLGYHEPPNYIRPVGETEGAAMLAAGDWADARAAYQRALVERPRSGLALYGVAMSSEKAGDTASASRGYADFLAAWKDADPTLDELTHARAYIASGGAAGKR